jgi:hypothetical protein
MLIAALVCNLSSRLIFVEMITNYRTNFKIPMMKKSLVSLVLVLMISFSAYSQGIYFRAGTGYGFPIATSSIGENLTRRDVYSTTGTTYSSSVEGIKASYGKGLDFNFALGYKINQNFIIDLNFIYLLGSKYETGSTYRYDSGTFIEIDDDVTTTSAKGFLINPSIIFSAGFGKAAPYARFGLVAGAPSLNSVRSMYYNGDGVDSTIIKGEYTKGLAFGFQGAVGMNWKLSEKLDLFTEVNFIGMAYYPGEYNVTQSIRGTGNSKVDNIYDNLPTMTVSQKNTVYEKQYDPTKVNTDPNKPTTALREAFPFSSLSLQVGIRFSIGTKEE